MLNPVWHYSPLVLITSGNLVIGLVCVLVCVAVPTHISVGRNFLILGMMVGDNVGLMPVVLIWLIPSGIPDARTKMSGSKRGAYVISTVYVLIEAYPPFLRSESTRKHVKCQLGY